MSRRLIECTANLPNVELARQAERLDAVTWRDRRSGSEARKAIRHLFLFIGAEPSTDWLARSGVALDDKGFVRTGAWPTARPIPDGQAWRAAQSRQ